MDERNKRVMDSDRRGLMGGAQATRDRLKSRKGFGYRVRQARARPSNTSITDLLSDDRYTEAVLAFLGATRVGEVRRGVICK
jgi:hypothetical protein